MRITDPNLAPNPVFERLNPAGNNFPVCWGAGTARGASVTITKVAHSGSQAVEMKATAPVNCWMNSQVIPVREGRVTFWFRALSSSVAGKNLIFYVIGVNAAGIESTPPCRLRRSGGRCRRWGWHKGALQFDYRNQPVIKGIIPAPRINEGVTSGKGDWMLDNVDLRRARRPADMGRIPSFYTCQAICTTLSGATPDRHVKAQLITAAPDKTPWTFRDRHGALLLASCSAIATARLKDHAPGVPGTLVIRGVHPHRVEAIDPLYGKTQRLDFTETAAGVKIPGLLIRNYPLILRIRRGACLPPPGALRFRCLEAARA